MAYTQLWQPAKSNTYWNLPDIQVGGLVLHSIGTPQPSAQTMAKLFNSPTVKASVHGFIEPGLFIATAPCNQERRRAKKCYHVGAGSRGSYNSTHIGIEMCEPKTIKYTGGASFADSDKAATTQYIKKVTATAAEVFADLCIFHTLTPEFITTHAQAHREGYGSGHGDPEHLWNYIGYSLEKFRQDVQKIINEKEYLKNMTKAEFNEILDQRFAATTPIVYKTINDVPEWGKATVNKFIAQKLLTGDEAGNLNLSYDFLRTLVVLDRLGLTMTNTTIAKGRTKNEANV